MATAMPAARWAPARPGVRVGMAQLRSRAGGQVEGSFARCRAGQDESAETSGSDKASPSTLDLGDPSSVIVYGGRLPSKRRFFLGTSLAAFTALGANFLGVTSALLTSDPELFSEQLRMDVLYPINGLKRELKPSAYTFLYPATWLSDVTVARRSSQSVGNSLDPPPLRKKKKKKEVFGQEYGEPTSALGPPGSTGELNISVVAGPIQRGFELRMLGPPEEAAQVLLGGYIRSEDKEATLGGAEEIGEDLYVLEYTVKSKSKGWKRRIISVYGARDDVLYTYTAQCPEGQWEKYKDSLRGSARSFRLLE